MDAMKGKDYESTGEEDPVSISANAVCVTCLSGDVIRRLLKLEPW